jgi:hypothetical protein
MAHDLHTLSPIGYDTDGNPIWPARGGRGGLDFTVDDRDGDEPDDFDETDEDDEGDEDDDEDSGDEGDGDDEGTPRSRRTRKAEEDTGDDWEPPSRDAMARIEAAMARNNNENRKNRLVRKILGKLGVNDESEFSGWLLDRGIDPDTGQRITDGAQRGNDPADGEDKPDRTAPETVVERRRAEERGAARATAQYQPALVQFAAAAAIRDAGYAGKNMSLALRLIDTDQVDVEWNENGEPIIFGLDEQVEEVKKDFPDLFRTARAKNDEEDGTSRRRRAGGRTPTGARQIDGGERPRGTTKPMGWLERADRQLRGQR